MHRELARETQREAFMRRAIDRIAKQSDGPVVVVCGAWHVPALQRRVSAKSDRDTLKSLPRKLPVSKLRQAWIPWATAKLASRSGYGAGVQSPMWYQHLWRYRNQSDWLERWLTRTARGLRDNGYTISTASIIEATRLCQSLAAVRGRPAAAEAGLLRLSERAFHTSDTYSLLTRIPALISINRYGTARDISLGHIGELIQRVPAQATVALPYACRNLGDQEAQNFHRGLQEVGQALPLMTLDSELLEHMRAATPRN